MTSMEVSAQPTAVESILALRDLYRLEMDCQIIHDSLHSRAGWTQPYLLHAGNKVAGYASVVHGGPWAGKPAIFEFYVEPDQRVRAFDLFQALVAASKADMIEVQTSDPLITIMLHTFADHIVTESLLFVDNRTTAHILAGAEFRPALPGDEPSLCAAELDPEAQFVVQINDAIAAAGGILYHYNPPYGDIYMKVAEPFRRRGAGTYIVQEMKRFCRQAGKIPGARCNPTNVASRSTLLKAGFLPCGHILSGTIRR